jgi:psiF repeat
MQRLAVALFAWMFAFASASGGALAQKPPRTLSAQEIAVKHLGCKKEANTKKLTGAERQKFMADCQK